MIGYQLQTVAFFADGDISSAQLHDWRICVGMDIGLRSEVCAHRMFMNPISSTSLRTAPNGLPLFVRKSDEPCECRR